MSAIRIDGARLDYVHSPLTAAAEKRRVEKAREAAKAAAGEEELVLLLDRLEVRNSDEFLF